MDLETLARIEDPVTRFVQSTKFLSKLQQMLELTVEIRDRSLLESRELLSQPKLGALIGVSQQSISRTEQRAKERYLIEAPFDRLED